MKISPGWKGTGIVLLLMPIFHAVIQALISSGEIVIAQTATFVIGFLLLGASFLAPRDSMRAFLGLLAGFVLWGSIGELGHLLHGESHGGHHSAVSGAQWGLVLLMCMGYFVMIRPYSNPGNGRDRTKLGVCVAMEFFLLVWFFHVVLLTAYYHPAIGVDSWITHLVFWICGALGVYLTKLLGRINCLANGIRTGVLVSCVLWTALEVPMKWGWLAKPWLPMQVEIIVGISVLLLIWILVPVHEPASRGAEAQ